ncbi:MAG TPA: MCE family protein, partial [Blastocatellia bacterium]|nr:MCE family protein [Blastocatellia bacterium]
TVASLRSISDRLDRGEGSAGKLLRDEQLYNNLNQTTAEMVKMLYDFRQDPKKYLRVKVSLF